MDLERHAWRSPRGLQAYYSNENQMPNLSIRDHVPYESQVRFTNLGEN